MAAVISQHSFVELKQLFCHFYYIAMACHMLASLPVFEISCMAVCASGKGIFLKYFLFENILK